MPALRRKFFRAAHALPQLRHSARQPERAHARGHTRHRHGRLLQNLISGFKLKAKSLYEATKDPDAEPLLWTREQEKAFNKIKQALTGAFALGVPPFLKSQLSYMKLKDGGQPWRSLYKS